MNSNLLYVLKKKSGNKSDTQCKDTWIPVLSQNRAQALNIFHRNGPDINKSELIKIKE